MGRTSVELFAGGGGLAQAAARAGFRPLLMNEFASRACESLESNTLHGHPVAYEVQRFEVGDMLPIPGTDDPIPLVAGPIQKLDMEYLQGQGVDLLAGGPPCQPFSLGGNSKGDEDKRDMFPEMFRAIRAIRPKAVICENVLGLLRDSFRPYFDYIKRELELPFVERKDGASWQEHNAALKRQLRTGNTPESERYRVIVTRVNAADYGVPQIRERVIIVAFRSDLNVDIEAFKQSIKPRYSETALIASFQNGTYWGRHPTVPQHVKKQVMERVAPPLPFDDDEASLEDSLPWRTLRDALQGIREGEGPLPYVPMNKLDRKTTHGGFVDHIGWPDGQIYAGHTPNDLDRPAKTVKAGVHGVAGGELVMYLDRRKKVPKELGSYRRLHRYMTVREVARVMTFPDDWVLKGPRGEKMRQLGNAVPVMLGEVFTTAVSQALDLAEDSHG
ncbi:DNA cytosine methyltransferase [Streptomyces sp. NPDC017940]|uniref:DNA cytosine methyltransferase n=1 Tax=Streptomyces sp. NPDC017940 TaxID=3365017 RepID=UPI0037A08601